jgi:hypothetical protein
MSKVRVQYLLAIAIWAVVAIGFSVTVFSSGGPAAYADDSQRRIVGGVFLAFGIFGNPLLRLLIRSGPNAKQVDRDERDEQIAVRSTNIGMITVVLFVFLGGIALWDGYQEAGCVPVGWMWVLAYSTLILSHLIPALISLVLDLGVLRHAKG